MIKEKDYSGNEMFLRQVVAKNKNLPDLLREVADYIETGDVKVWEILIDAEPASDEYHYARLILAGFVEKP